MSNITTRNAEGSPRVTGVVETTDGTPTVLPVGTGLLITASTTWVFRILLVARRTDALDESAGYKFEGVIDRGVLASTTALVGSVAKTVLAEDTAGWDAAVTADATNGGLTITVTGEAAKTIRWKAKAELVEVSA